MDPITILSIAAATAQFIDFGLKTVVLCKQIRDSATGSAEYHSELQLSIKRLNAIKKGVDVKQCPAGTSRALKQTVQDCSSVAGELETLLLDIHAIAKKKPLGALRAALCSLKDQKKIEKLQNKLEKCQDRFHASVSMDTREKVLELLAKQGKASDTIDHFLVPKLQSMHLDSSKANKETHSKLATLKSQQQASSSKIIQIQEDARQEMHVRFDEAEHHAQNSDLHESFLKNLEYPEMFARKRSIHGPSSKTFDWIFTGELREGYDFQGRKGHRGKFSRWLQDDQNVFWINGKAGSGKSSLMSYIENDRRTTELLKVWAGDRPLHIFSFFFWRAGSDLQKSIVGMLQCLLHQLAQKKPAVIDPIIQNDPATRYAGAWNEARLLRALPTALSFYQGECVVCLIDGLDEFEGQYRDLLRTLFTMQCTSGMKLCVSSRPEAALETRLSQFESIRLQDLNYNDIRTFVQNEFSSCGNAFDEKLVDEVTSRAEGIFLWAVLVCRSFMNGHEAKDDAKTLQQRLRSIPSGLQDIVRYMFSNLDEVHHANISVYFHLLKWESELRLASNWVNVALITVMLHKQPFRSWQDFTNVCHGWQNRIVAQCKGLIEIPVCNYDTRPKWALRDISTGSVRHKFLDEDDTSTVQDFTRSCLQ